MALTPDEIGKLLRVIYRSSMKRAHKLALHLLILCMVRKSELIEAKWEELDLEKAEWAIPGERMKKDKPHLVSLSRQAVAMCRGIEGAGERFRMGIPEPGRPETTHCEKHLECRGAGAGNRRAGLRDSRLPADGINALARGGFQFGLDREMPSPRNERHPGRLQPGAVC